MLIILFIEDGGSFCRFFISVGAGIEKLLGRPLLGVVVCLILFLKEVDSLVESCTELRVGCCWMMFKGSFCMFLGVSCRFLDSRGDLRGMVTLLHVAWMLFGWQTDV